MKFYCPLRISINNDIKQFKLSGFIIRKITETDRKNLFGIINVEFDDSGRISQYNTDNNHQFKKENITVFLTELEIIKLYSTNYIIEFDSEMKISDIFNLLLALRLLTTDNIFAPIVFNNRTPSLHGTGSPVFCKYVNNYQISKSDIKEIKLIYKLIGKLQRDSNLFIALESYNFAVNEKTDRRVSFISLVSILEALFLDNDIKELSFRFSIITSYVLSNKLKGITASFDQMKRMYDMRSKLVHSGRDKSFSEADLKLIQSYTNQLIIWLLKNRIPYSEIQSMIFKKLKICKY